MSAHRLDVLLVNPGGRKTIYQSLGTGLTAIEPPIWAGLMAGFLRMRGYSVAILDTNAEEINGGGAAARIVDMRPVLAVIVAYGHNPSASTQVMPSLREICSALKEMAPECRVLLVGGHVAALPERTYREEEADFVCTGEGPYTIMDLIEVLKTRDLRHLSAVRDLLYAENGTLQRTAPAPLVTRLDEEMPGMPWDLLPMEKYRAHNWHCFGELERHPYASIYTTLGCPFHCSYCCIQAPFRNGERELGYKARVNSYRFWSPQAVLRQIDEAVTRYGVRNIKIADEMFVLNRVHVAAICDLIVERGYDLNIWAYARVDTVKDGMLEKLKRAGVNWLCFGFESGSPRVRSDVNKGFDQETMYHTVEKVREAGIYIIGNYLLGLPEDDSGTMQETLDMAQTLNCEFANIYSAMAYPGSELYATALREGWPLPQRWSGYSQHAVDTLPLPTRHISGGEVLKFRDRAWQAYFTDSNYLNMILAKFGPATVAGINNMTSIRLERKYA